MKLSFDVSGILNRLVNDYTWLHLETQNICRQSNGRFRPYVYVWLIPLNFKQQRSVADPGFPVGGGANSWHTYVSKNLHVKVKESGPLGAYAGGALPPLGSADEDSTIERRREQKESCTFSCERQNFYAKIVHGWSTYFDFIYWINVKFN